MIEARIRSTHTLTQALTIAFLIPVFSYPLVVAVMVGPQNLGPGTGGHSWFITRLAVLAAILILVATGRISQMPIEFALKKQASSRNAASLLGAYLVSVLLGLVLREFAALIGVVLSMWENNLTWCVLLGAASFLMMLKNWPQRASLRQLFPEANI